MVSTASILPLNTLLVTALLAGAATAEGTTHQPVIYATSTTGNAQRSLLEEIENESRPKWKRDALRLPKFAIPKFGGKKTPTGSAPASTGKKIAKKVGGLIPGLALTLPGLFGDDASDDVDAVYFAYDINDNPTSLSLGNGHQVQLKGKDDNPLSFFTFTLPENTQFVIDAYKSYDDQHWDVYVAGGSGHIVGSCHADGDAVQKVSNTVARAIVCSVDTSLN
ncbi:hypothetical protein DIURU_005340 [Diutina rugosa]|uniref:Uncharacterized protein n=1 Tax=Diutina rugosa TaxID=5481 RepID=A0A642UE04_DIURU|nr:uncharacterized protein DIURU_005340 [Diutina rugosa]KAA8897363.1 hypothetical protein DIURU_005340 [Diutina rugosa]